jgi:small-conductance mechanosensitive channel
MKTDQQAKSQSNELSRLERVALEDGDLSRMQQAVSAPGQESKPAVRNKDKVWFVAYLLVFLGMGGVVVLLSKPVGFLELANALRIQGYLRGAMVMVVVLALAHALDVYVVGGIPSAASRFNLRRIVRLLTGVVLALIALSMLFANWDSTVISLGLISLVLGFALQTPISSLIGWVYILVRVPYRVGDRIQMGDARGDVIDVSYLDTTLWEFGGDYLSTDHPSGRITGSFSTT